MARFCGEVGFAESRETRPGVWEDAPVERRYYGDISRASNRPVTNDTIITGVSFNNSITIVADAYALNNFSTIRYVKYRGTAWRVTYVEIKHPRLQIEFGGVYNGPTA